MTRLVQAIDREKLSIEINYKDEERSKRKKRKKTEIEEGKMRETHRAAREKETMRKRKQKSA